MPAPPDQGAPPLDPPIPQSATVQDALAACQESFREFVRAAAAFSSLDRAYRTAYDQLEAGERQAGLPIFEWPATADGRDHNTVSVDIKRVRPDMVPNVMLPLIDVCARECIAALDELGQNLVQARQVMLPRLLAAQQKDES